MSTTIQTMNCRLHGEQQVIEHIEYDEFDNGFRYHWDYAVLACKCEKEIDSH